jgi:neutral ceramidase
MLFWARWRAMQTVDGPFLAPYNVVHCRAAKWPCSSSPIRPPIECCPMNLRRSLLTCGLLAFGFCAFSPLVQSVAEAQTWKAGASTRVITPEKYIWMSGYGSRDRPADGKLTELYAKALVLEDGQENRAVLISLDLVGIDASLTAKICGSLKEKYQLERRQIAISTSHTHTGPAVGMNLAPLHYLQVEKAQQKLLDEYADQLHDNVVGVVGEALEAREPSNVSWGNGHCSVAVNRRTNPESDVPQRRLKGTLVGPSDHDVPVLIVRKPTGELTTVVFGYACHATVLSFYKWSGDYPGFAQESVERRFPGCVALFWAGCGADQNPLPRRTPELAQQYGDRLGHAVAEVVNGATKPLRPTIATNYEEIPLKLGKLPSKEELEDQAKNGNKYMIARAKWLLERMENGEKLRQDYDYPVEVWKLGDEITWVFLGGEVVIDYAVRLKAELTGTRTWVAGYSNDVMAYIPSRRVLREGGYEGGGAMVYYGLPTVWGEECEKQIVDEIHRQAKAR